MDILGIKVFQYVCAALAVISLTADILPICMFAAGCNIQTLLPGLDVQGYFLVRGAMFGYAAYGIATRSRSFWKIGGVVMPAAFLMPVFADIRYVIAGNKINAGPAVFVLFGILFTAVWLRWWQHQRSFFEEDVSL
ncbi:MAG TPA: hypothetical protein VKB67_04785 [Rhizomicrobium sp.]|nr:hypothetical protein [Rhizomicrobium sp.]